MGHFGFLHGKVFHAHGGLEVAELQLDLPTFHVEVGELFGRMALRVKKVGDNNEGCFFPGSVFVSHLDVTQGDLVGQRGPFFGTQFAARRLLRGFFPGDKPLDGADFFSAPPVEFAMSGLVQAHEDVTLFFVHDADDEFVGAEGSVAEEEVAFVDMLEQAWSHAGIVLGRTTGLEANDATVAEVDHADKPHEGEAAAFFLGGVLGVFKLVLRRVHEGEGGSVDGFEDVPVVEIALLDPLAEGGLNTFINPFEEAFGKSDAGLAVATGVAVRDRELEGSAPVLDEAHRLAAARIALKDLSQPCPEDGGVRIVANPAFGLVLFQKINGKDRLEENGIAAEFVFDQGVTQGANCGLRTAFGSGKNCMRKVGKQRLIFHIF